MYHVYFAKSLKNGKVYVGFTTKTPATRITEHNNGSNQWSKVNRPFSLIYYESFHCEEDGRAREKFFKTGLGKKIKKAIIAAMGKDD